MTAAMSPATADGQREASSAPISARDVGGLREIALFAGAGGGVLGSLLLGHKIIGYVEWDEAARSILQARIRDGILDPAPIFGDIREFLSSGAAACYRGVADLVSGGFPCPAFSVAGQRKGYADERNLWPETLAVLREVRPRFGFFENVPGLATAPGPDGQPYFWRILADLHELGYDAAWCVLGADDLGAPHRRKRLWILAWDRERLADAGGLRARGGLAPAGSREARPAGTPGNGDMRERLAATVGDADASGRSEQRSAVADGAQRATAQRGGQPLANADDGQPDERQGEASATDERTIAGRVEYRARGRGWNVADAAEPRRARAKDAGAGSGREGTDERGILEPEREGATLADADLERGDRVHERLEPGHVAPDALGSGEGREAGARLPDASPCDEDDRRHGASAVRGERPEETELPGGQLWPPGPDDAEGWRRWLEHYPGTEPAVPRAESPVRGGVASIPGRLDVTRSARLRCLGNAQVPPTMALAFVLLARRAGLLK